MNSLKIAFAFLLLSAPSGVAAGPPPPLSPDQEKLLESVRANALEYTQTLPDFICTQITHREISTLNNFSGGVSGRGSALHSPVPGPDLPDSVIEERLTYFNRAENYEVVAVDGKKVKDAKHLQFLGAITAGEFGSKLDDIFNPASHARFNWERSANLHGRRLDVFGFNVPKSSGATVIHRGPDSEIVVAYGGRIFIDPDTLEVLRIESKLDLPPNYPIQAADTTVEYTPVEVAGKKVNLPIHSEVRLKDESYVYVNTIDFKNYHRFGTESTIHYESPQ